MFRKKARGLEVHPVRRYRQPRYPKAGDPVVLDLKDARTWPFPSAIAALVIAAAGTSSCDTAAPGISVPVPPGEGPSIVTADIWSEEAHISEPDVLDPPDMAEPDDAPDPIDPPPDLSENGLESPFSFERSQLPPTNVWGKGVPGVLPEEVAVQAVLNAFEQRGLHLSSGVAFNEGGVSVELDGYASGLKVGFEFLSTEWSDMPWTTGPGEETAPNPHDYQEPDEWVQDPETGEYVPIINEDDPNTLSESEMLTLDADMQSGKRYLALINSLDPRFVYPPGSVDGPEYPDDYWSSMGMSNDSPGDAEDALVEAVHEFIDYLEAEGVL